MTEMIELAYGRGTKKFRCKRAPDIYSAAAVRCQIDEKRFAARIDRFLDAAQLDLRAVAVVVADKTRLCGYPRYLPVLLDAIERHGALPRNVTIWVAYGTHGQQTDDESRNAYGEAFKRCRWVHHMCDGDRFVNVGTCGNAAPVYWPQALARATCVITFGAISHHYFAGFGGGRKLIFPGLGRRSSIYANHALFLDQNRRTLADGCRPGMLDGNPLAEDLARIEAVRPAHMAIHGILDRHGRVCDLLVGQGENHFRNACAVHARHCAVAPMRRYGLVVASAGGYPKDINFIQSHKAIHHAADFVADGGRLVVLARCRDGIGSETFLPWFELGGWDAAFDALSAQYAGNGGTALATMAKTRRIRIAMISALDLRVCRTVGLDSWSCGQLQLHLNDWNAHWALLPNAGMTVAAPGQIRNLRCSQL